MFLSAGTIVKFHTWPPEENDTPDPTYTSSIPSTITHASWCNDNNYLALLSENGNPEVVSTRDKNYARLVHTVQALPDVTSLAFQKTTKKYLALGTANAQIALYDTKHRAITKLYTNLTSAVRDVDFNIEDRCMAAACDDGIVAVYGVTEDDTNETLKMPSMARPTVLRFHPRKTNHLAVCSEKGEVVLWDIATSKKIFYAQPHTDAVSGLALASCDAFLISVGRDHKLCVYDANIGECLFRSSLQEPLSSVDIMVRGNCMAVGSDDGIVYIYDVRRLVQPLHTFQPHSTRVNKIMFANQFIRPKAVDNAAASKASVDTGLSTTEDLNESHERLREENVANNINGTTTTVNGTDSVLYESLKKAMIKTLRLHINDLSNKLSDYFVNLKELMESEIATLDTAIDEKCLSLITQLLEEEKQNSDTSISENKEEFVS